MTGPTSVNHIQADELFLLVQGADISHTEPPRVKADDLYVSRRLLCHSVLWCDRDLSYLRHWGLAGLFLTTGLEIRSIL